MLIVTHSSTINSNDKMQNEFSLGEGKTITQQIGFSTKVLRIQVNGDECRYILTICNNLPYIHNSNQHIWTGDFAQFIADNVVF